MRRHLARRPRRALALSHPRKARAAPRRPIRRAGRQLRLLAWPRRAARQAHSDARRPPRRAAAAAAIRAHARSRRRHCRHAAHVSEAGRAHRRQAGRAHSQLPDAALAAPGALLRDQRRPLRAGRAHLHALHFAHPPLSRPDRASHHQGAAARRRRRAKGTVAEGRHSSPWTHPNEGSYEGNRVPHPRALSICG